MRQNWSGSNLTLNCWAQHRFFFLTSFLCPTILHTYLFPISSDLRKLVPSSRYCIERVFRPRKLDRFHPKELLECAFDIVTSTTNSSLPTAETIYTIYEIIQEFPALQVLSRSVTCCLVLIAEAEGPIPTAASCWVLEQIMAFLKQLQSLRVTLWASSWTRASTLNWFVGGGGPSCSLPILTTFRNEAASYHALGALLPWWGPRCSPSFHCQLLSVPSHQLFLSSSNGDCLPLSSQACHPHCWSRMFTF